MSDGTRTEVDSMGTVEVPREAYYGPQTARAAGNFRLSSLRFPRRFIAALGLVKAAAARTNTDLGLLDERRGRAIEQAAREVAEGRFDAEFVVDVFQTGSGTSTNMNANEVIANRAAEIFGGGRGETGSIHPNDHVNLGQSTNDVFPTALHLAALGAVEHHVLPSMRQLADALDRKAAEWASVVKAARTHLQDAVPITLGQEFSGYASVVRHGLTRLASTRDHLAELAIGGTAAGTGINAHPEFATRVIAELCRLSGLTVRRADNPFEAMQNRDAAVELSGACRTVAVGLMKLANDLRLLSSGPLTGLAEIALPDLQPGSSIMPGKVNPVIPEAVNMVAAQVIGLDAAIAAAAMNGSLDLNTMMPIIAYDLLEMVEILGTACAALAGCVDGIVADVERCRAYAERSPSIATALAPLIGYDAASALVKQALAAGVPIAEAIRAHPQIAPEQVERALDLLALTRGGRAR
jgi:fumarate hydratase class II